MNAIKIESSSKVCRGCNEEKSITDYRLNPSGKSQRNFCKKCESKKAKKVSEGQKESARTRRLNAILAGEMDKCVRCSGVFKVSQLQQNSSTHKGYNHVCKNCLNKDSKRIKSESSVKKENLAFDLRKENLTKVCRLCGEEKSLFDFGIRLEYKDAHDSKCKSCESKKSLKRYYDDMENQKDYKKKNIEVKRRWVWNYLLEHPCVDCGCNDARILQFDHLSDKIDSVSRLVSQGNSLQSVMEEVAKCEVRCSGCHDLKTLERGNHWRHRYWIEQNG